MLDRVRRRLLPEPLDAARTERLRAFAKVNSAGFDPWGMHLATAEESVRWFSLLWRYFRVRVHGIENVPSGRVLLVPNHGGQLPIDGILVGMAMVLEADPPRIVRGMVERWFPTLPFVSSLFTRCGQVVGDPANCAELLDHDQAIMVFPEGVGGSGKLYRDRYRLQRFGTGFLRLALAADAPIVPVAVIGGEETFPAIYNAKGLAKLVGAPYMPVTPFWPLLGPAGAVPLPVQIDLHFGAPMRFTGDPDAPDKDVEGQVAAVRDRLQGMVDAGLAERPDLRRVSRWFGGQR